MIYGELKEIDNYRGISKNLDLAFDYIKTGAYKNGKYGKNEVIGDTVYFNMPENAKTKDKENGFIESHKQFIDIHIVISGDENIGYLDPRNGKIVQEYNENGDFAEWKGEVEMFFHMDNTKFLIFFPDEPHMAMVKFGEDRDIKKVIFKVEVENEK